jgi:uncharacterized transporter YbjL
LLLPAHGAAGEAAKAADFIKATGSEELAAQPTWGLNLFIACVGLSAGPPAIAALKQAGVTIFIAGVCLNTIPHCLTWLFGLYVLKINPALLIGAMTGAGTLINRQKGEIYP